MVDVMFVNPNARLENYGQLAKAISAIEPPVWCALLAGYERNRGLSVKILDAETLNLSPEQTADEIAKDKPLLTVLVVLGSTPSQSSTPKMPAVRKVLEAMKGRCETKTMLLGQHPSALPVQTMQHEIADYVCVGEGFFTVYDVVRRLEAKMPMDNSILGLVYRDGVNIVKNGQDILIDPVELPMAAWDLLPMDKYRDYNWHCLGQLEGRSPYAVIHTSFGCPYNCRFCNAKTIYGNRSVVRYRKPKDVVAEIGYLVEKYGVRNIKIADELFTYNLEHVNEICDMLISKGYDLNIWAYTRAGTVDLETLKKMRSAGITWLGIGIESANWTIRAGQKKPITDKVMAETIKKIRMAGIFISGNFIFGLPNDDWDTMQQTYELAKRINCEFPAFHTAMPYPGSQWFDETERVNAHPKPWSEYAQLSEETLPLATKHLLPGEILRFRDDAFMKYFSNPEYQKSIEKKFGKGGVAEIQKMLEVKIERRWLLK